MSCTITKCTGCDVLTTTEAPEGARCADQTGCSDGSTDIDDYDVIVTSGNAVIWALMLVVAACISAPWLLIAKAELGLEVSPYALPVLLTLVLTLAVVLLAIYLDSFKDLVFISGKEMFGKDLYAALVTILIIVPAMIMIAGIVLKRPAIMYGGAASSFVSAFVMALVYQAKASLEARKKDLCTKQLAVAWDENSGFSSMLAIGGFFSAATTAVGVLGVFVATTYVRRALK